MRVLIATPLYPPEPGGPATYTKLLEEGFPGLGVEFLIIKFADVRSYPKLVRHLVYLFKIAREAREYDLILVLDPVSTGLPVALAALLTRKPFVLRVGGDYAWEQARQRFGLTMSLDEFVRTKQLPFFVGILRSIETWVANRAQLVIVPSNYLKGIVAAWGIAHDKISVIYNAIEPRNGGHVPASVKDVTHPRIVTSARLVPWKGIQGIIDAVKEIHGTFPKASLIVIGDGPERAPLEAYANGAIGNAATFTGQLGPSEAYAVLKTADVFILNSTYEGLSHVLIEALSSGVPIIATDAGGNPEVITTDKNGIVIPINNTPALVQALGDLLSSEDLRRRLIHGAQESQEKFSLPTMLARTREALESLI